MSSKRKLPSLGLERRVRPRKEEEWEPEVDSEDNSSADEAVSDEEVGRQEDDSEQDGDSGSDTGSDVEVCLAQLLYDEITANTRQSEESGAQDTPKIDLSSVSFGALARAQASLPPSELKKKRQKTDSANTESKDASRPRASKAKADKPSRSSKHAPQEVSSKKPVSRRREIIADTRRRHRDPRFDTLGGTGGRVEEVKAKKAYAFLDEYRDKEMADLRVQIKKTKDVAAKEELKRQLLSMESKRKARQRKEEAERLIQEHRRKEKELVAQGKQPFYLKRSEQKKQLLVDRFAGMSKGQVDKAIERRRKKVSSKEKKELISMERVRDRR
ncbi:rRNA biogenesis protein RRP36 [Paramyrothecium foliicola]|nr:rRNA biogenesis protein RRP36 [Paramyrothecium foliicola]